MDFIPASSFGEIVATMRKDLAKMEGRKITQGDLAEALSQKLGTYISERTIARLEQDQKLRFRKDRLIIDGLADALKLPEALMREFYLSAGLVYQSDKLAHALDENILEQSLRDLLTNMSYPFHVLTPLWDMIAFNNYMYHLYGYTNEQISLIKGKKDFHNNLLVVLFNSAYKSKEYFGNDQNWQTQMIRNLKAFRALSFRYQASSEYKKLIGFISSKYAKDFNRLWALSYLPDKRHQDYELPVEPSTLIKTPAGQMKFWTIRFPQEYIGDQVVVLGHLPADEISEANFLKFKKDIPKSLHYFGMPDYSLATSKKPTSG
jgi:PAS domain-containing protein